MPETPLDALSDFIAQCGGQKAAAKKLRVSPQFVGQLVHGIRPIPDALLARLGWKRVVLLRKLSA